jgi:8-oxo-dGTP pyrophosphatase MutT (NUDIX family)
VSVPRPAGDWLAALRDSAQRPPRRPRVPLLWGDAPIGSVEPDLLRPLSVPSTLACQVGHGVQSAWRIEGDDLTASLQQLADTLRTAGLAQVWRNEQLAVGGPGQECLATVERAVVRLLGISTCAVHLVGRSPDGRHWVQQRSHSKANDPGLWDTLVGGMIPAAETSAEALERETWEEAGLGLGQLAGLRRCCGVDIRRPTTEPGAGYVVEHIECYRCIVPEGVVPANRDGEVAQFKLMGSEEVMSLLEHEEFTLEAALILLEAGL